MATEQQIAANRENAKHSTGPRTETGKAASSSSALRHGLASRGLIIIPGYEEAFEQLQSDLRATLVPNGPLQELLFKRALTAAWNLHRCQEAEALIYQKSGRPMLDPILNSEINLEFERVRKYAREAENSMYKAMRELAKLQDEAQYRRETQIVATADEPAEPVSELCSLKRVRTTVATQSRNEAKTRAINADIERKQTSHRNEPIHAVETGPQVARTAA